MLAINTLASLISSKGLLGLRSLATVAGTNVAASTKTRVSDTILSRSREDIAKGTAHFRLGGKKLYFPKARVILLRPNAKHTPYQAKFIVPKSFNKLDLRDYLFHLYGLRAMNITTQLLHGRYARVNLGTPRYREPQIKKMTIDMAEPFIWPEEPKKEENNAWNDYLVKNLQKYREDRLRLGSDEFKPGTAFDGAVGPFKQVAQPFIPKFLGKRIENKKTRYQAKLTRMRQLSKLDKFVNL
ncbi:hypothetical protein HG535_0D04640 [Zygotorulaspora mrakii]|uniref:Large ribosomal subunit protein uL23m n=1 Tax=Zygotorulaspora mrakii TaxID=42260 RepID=A0A7H9B276_ZYGMR|nr:uncharacterized protein HG535_0D04640 [Zygotorulaspora mrakii]QLG72755.1 hypothetical protein HG535_0D04640 [Zygotorulaspora mrakii]